MTGHLFAPDGFDFTFSALCFPFLDWAATFLLVWSVDDLHFLPKFGPIPGLPRPEISTTKKEEAKMSEPNRQSEPLKIAILRGSGRGIGRAFLGDSKFFFTLYHAGKVNIIPHLVSLAFLFYGLALKSVPLVLVGLFIFDEMGHAYNYFFVHNRDPRFGLRMIPYQFLYASLIMPVLLKLFGWF